MPAPEVLQCLEGVCRVSLDALVPFKEVARLIRYFACIIELDDDETFRNYLCTVVHEFSLVGGAGRRNAPQN